MTLILRGCVEYTQAKYTSAAVIPMKMLHWEETTHAHATALTSKKHVEADMLSMAGSYIQLYSVTFSCIQLYSVTNQRTRFSKGHIALGNACFLNGTNGHALDILARIPSWKDGLGLLIIDMALVMMNRDAMRMGTSDKIGKCAFVKEADTNSILVTRATYHSSTKHGHHIKRR
uniref:Uncharacterized protein n=1 Tax=Populus alba TaxID=43335 RepID=A0A4U5R124_POPAL|nr:hypothetical protein D5086_0000015390 [Populus alba]